MEICVFKIDGDPVHAFLATDMHAAACIVRSMFDRTLYGFLTEYKIAAATPGARLPKEPSLFDEILNDNFSIERYDADLGWIVLCYDPVLDDLKSEIYLLREGLASLDSLKGDV